VLFDEIEKAHSDVFNVLLQIFDDGRLTDGQGRVVNFKNTVIIMTSNIGTHLIERDNPREAIERKINEEFKRYFKPEFLNRVDETIIFNYLREEDMEKIVSIQLEQVSKRLKENNNVELVVTKKAIELLASEGFDPVYGARPLKRLIQRKLVDPLALRVLEGEVKPGQTVKVDVSAGDIVFV